MKNRVFPLRFAFQKKHPLKYLSTFKFNSVFARTFLTLMIMMIILIVFFYQFAVNIITKNIEERSELSNSTMLEQTCMAVDLLLSNLEISQHNTLLNQKVIRVVMAPELQNYSKNYAMIQELVSATREQSMVKRAFLYLYSNRQIFTSDNRSGTIDNMVEGRVLRSYLAAPQRNVFSNVENGITDFRFIDGRLFLFHSFPGTVDSEVGLLAYELNADGFYEVINKKRIDTKRTYVFNRDMQTLFYDQLDETSRIIQGNRSQMTKPKGIFYAKSANGATDIYFYHQSQMNGWVYVYPVHVADLELSFGSFMTTVSPWMVVFFLISSAFSIYVAVSIYRPIRDLLISVGHSENSLLPADKASFRDEFDLLAQSFQSTVARTDEMVNVIESVRPIVLERLFMSLLRGEPAENIDQTLESINSRFRTNGRFVMLALSALQKDTGSMDDVQRVLFDVSMLNTVKSLVEQECFNFPLHPTPDTTAFVLFFPEINSPHHISQTVIKIRKALKKRITAFPYTVVVGCGRIYLNIVDIKFSYEEARKDLERQISLMNAGRRDETAEELTFDEHYFENRIVQFMSSLDSSTTAQSCALIARILSELKEYTSSPDSVHPVCHNLAAALTNRLLEIHTPIKDPIFTKHTVIHHIDDIPNVDHLCQRMLAFCSEAIERVNAYNEKRQHHYVTRAIEYIDKYSADSSLSLNVVAQHIGINSSYLSRLFFEVKNIHFVDYLNEVRVQKAKEMLSDTALTINDIGVQTGFNSMSTFFRVFKKIEGATPGQFRSARTEDTK